MADDIENFNFIEISLQEGPDLDYELPRHVRCVCHTLNLLGVTDAKNGLKHTSRICNSTLSKCAALWNCSRRPKASELIEQSLEHSLRTPCITRWNSLYESIKHLLENEHKLSDLFEKLSLPMLKNNEITFLRDYNEIFKPISLGLERLQGELDCTYGEVIPTLLAIQKKLKNLQLSESSSCKGLLTAVTCGLETRFSKFINLEDEISILASISHPFFKMRWVKNHLIKKHETILSCFKSAVKRENSNEVINDNAIHKPTKWDGSDKFVDFFDLENPDESSASVFKENIIEIEILNYLKDPQTDLFMLNRYPSIKKLFLKYNTILPSSAPVERLFSFAGMIRRPKRRRISDALFEKLIMLKTCK